MSDSNPDTERLLSHFRYAHLPPYLQKVSRPIGELALQFASTLGRGPELTMGLRKLLEAKDCLVRQAVIDHEEHE